MKKNHRKRKKKKSQKTLMIILGRHLATTTKIWKPQTLIKILRASMNPIQAIMRNLSLVREVGRSLKRIVAKSAKKVVPKVRVRKALNSQTLLERATLSVRDQRPTMLIQMRS